MSSGDVLSFYYTQSTQISISDADAGSNTVQVTLSATNGTISLDPRLISQSGVTMVTGTGTGDATMTFTGSVDACNYALYRAGFTPTFHWCCQSHG